ncbi:ubiquinol oxidase subunit II [Alloalcanivorax marinus]|uniref:ubiquinol oxidase subunit II n=1 Tax=Alloalcanivorax marinus TaxID=1177169 RepID=UPI0019340053|nr:ubiquinol oxidase subunit II [Alloalcanivorax marinus]MBL7250370.1 ubiquinol oxidase subunit II [Alloalcanivorax marinus]
MHLFKFLRLIPVLIAAALMSGCDLVLMSPSGDIAAQQRDLILWATFLMLLVIVPVIILTLVFAFRYRAGRNATYKPDWDHSTVLELVIWGAPLMIIIALGAMTWVSTHKLDPYRPLERIDANRPVPEGVEPLVIEVVSLDWKWLFFYPEQNVAVVNELAAPVDRPIRFKITSEGAMNSFFIPALAGQIYSMAGMETKLHAVINEVGVYDGFSANYSGAGFSDMRFKFHGLSDEDFDAWIAKVKASPNALTRDVYRELEQPSQANPVTYYASADETLYHDILNRCLESGDVCMDEMMAFTELGLTMCIAGDPRDREAGSEKEVRELLDLTMAGDNGRSLNQ